MAKQPAKRGPVNRPQVVRRNAVTAGEAKDYESRSLSRSRGAPSQPQGRGTLTRGETGDATSQSLRRAQNAKSGRSSATMTPSERGGFETKSLKQARTNPKVGTAARPKMATAAAGGSPPTPPGGGGGAAGGSSPPNNPPRRGGPLAKRGGTSLVPTSSSIGRVEKVVSGSHEMVRNRALPGSVASKGSRMLAMLKGVPLVGKLAGVGIAAFGAGTAAVNTDAGQKTVGKITNAIAGVTGLNAKQESYNLSGPAKGVKPYVKPRETAVAPAGQVPVVPSKTISSATPGSSSSPSSSNARTGSQKPSGASKGKGRAMSGKELADYLGEPADSAVRFYMETGKHKYPTKK